ncbi:MAG: hypothetical protein Kow0089_04760 [Desulfobulbaceae bacterium]
MSMEQFVAELRDIIPLKETTRVGDIVLLAAEDPLVALYAYVTAIDPDPAGRRSWWNVTLQTLTIPPQEVIWTLREPQFTGKEIFTFEGVAHFLQAVRFEAARPPVTPGPEKRGPRLRVVK